jgi:hypothetical protein
MSRASVTGKVFKAAVWLMLAGLVLSVLLVAAWARWGELAPHAVIAINGQEVDLVRLQGGQWLLAIAGVFAALLVVWVLVMVALVVVPLLLLLPPLATGLAGALALLLVAAVLVLLLSPLLLPLWAVWRLSRRRGPVATMAP